MADDVFCNRCGHRNAAGSNFCSSCGAPLGPPPGHREDRTTIVFVPEGLEGDEEFSVEAVDAGPAGVGFLVVKRGPNVGSRFALDKEVVQAGRHPESDIFLDDITVSRRHAEFQRGGDGYVVRDVGSLNGTYLNRERIDEEKLTNGDEVQIGKFKLVFLTGGEG